MRLSQRRSGESLVMPPACPVRYRVARSDDEPFLWTALYHAIHVPPGEAAPPPEIVHRPESARYVRGWSPQAEPGVIAETTADGQPVGAAWVRLLTGDGTGHGYVADDVPELSIAVLPGWRGRGVGTAMLERLLRAVEPRYRSVSLSVSRTNPAQRLYERLGFREVGSKDSSLIMQRVSRAGPAA